MTTLTERTRKAVLAIFQVLTLAETTPMEIEDAAEMLALNCADVMEMRRLPSYLRGTASRARDLADALDREALEATEASLEVAHEED